MFPIICKLGPLTIYTFGLMLATAVLVCTFLLNLDAKKAGLKSEIIFDLTFWLAISGLLGARIFYIILNLPYFIDNPFDVIMIQNGGLAWQGGLIFAGAFGVIFVKKKGLNVPKILDLYAPYLALGQSIGRVGCFFNGCCYGKEVTWGLFFPVHQAHLHPTQLYSTIGLLIIFAILKCFQKTSCFKGEVFVIYLILASLLRFSVEFFRADHEALIFGLSIFQFICLGLILGAIYVYSRFKS